MADQNYKYLLSHQDGLTSYQRQEASIDAVLGYVQGLKLAIERDDLVAMRRHREADHYLERFHDCAEKVRQALETAEPNLFALAAENEMNTPDIDMTMERS